MSSCACRSPKIWMEPMKKNSAKILLRRPPSDIVLNLVPWSFNGVRVFKLRASTVGSSSESSSNFAKRIEQAWLISQLHTPCSNLCLLHVILATQKGLLNANGVREQVSSYLVTTCFVKFHPETPLVSYALEGDQSGALIVKGLDFVPNGWGSHQSARSSCYVV
ncbi:hypothetical protein Cgig2_009921 [Carnegiea gigantea]|uniref:Uncharacterized protein n=1 Tax=Carnegiea gigantea TaxID=171969 RepID=A0A9Q1K4N2_9CARY|nr:hypothetical protein Cgig2_009921 [Carnegiea gigantea]